MADLALDSDKLNERPDVSRMWMSQYGLAYLGSCVAWAAPSQLLLGNQLMLMRPDDKENALSLLMMLGGAVMVVTSLFSGHVSDRTRSRIGRRLPWILGGAAVCAVCLVLLADAQNYIVLLVLWCIFQMFMAFVTNNLLTLGSDAAPQRQFGVISGVLGATYTLGLVGGTVIAAELQLDVAYYICAAVVIVLCAQLATGDGLRTLLRSESYGSTSLAGGVDTQMQMHATAQHARYRDYWWVFASRFVVNIGNYVALFYLLFYLADHIGVAAPNDAVLMLTIIYAAFTVVTSLLSGALSDRLGRRKIFVIFAALGVAIATVIMAFAHTMVMVVLGAIILGIAWGVFTAVDQAMINESLPSARHRARDISIMTLTVGITNMISGGIAAFALHHLGGYPGLYLLCAVVSVIGAVLVIPVRSSR